MRYITLFTLIFFISFTSLANIIEDKEPAILEVHYVKTSVSDTLKNRNHSDPMVLRIGKTASMFYPPKEMWYDSIRLTDYESYRKIYREVNPPGSKYTPISGLESEYLFRNVYDGETIVYRPIAGMRYCYTEPTESPFWEITSESKNILGYDCILAKCDFRGRQWNAWFAPDIPVKEGPWKLFGLPGLVLEANDSKEHYSYKAVGIYTNNLMPVGIKLYVRDAPSKLKSRQVFLQKMYHEYIKGNFTASMNAMFGKGGNAKPTESQYDYQERDYPHQSK